MPDSGRQLSHLHSVDTIASRNGISIGFRMRCGIGFRATRLGLAIRETLFLMSRTLLSTNTGIRLLRGN